MKTSVLSVSLLALGLGLFASGGAAGAGRTVEDVRMSAFDRNALRALIDDARQTTPEVFRAVATLRLRLPDLDRTKRGPVVAVAPLLRPLGAAGLPALLAELTGEGIGKGNLGDAAWHAWRVGLIEAVGHLRDPRTQPVLLAILTTTETDMGVVRAAAEALGKLGDDASAARLVTLATGAPAWRKAVLGGLGGCRRLVCVQALGDALASESDPVAAKAIARSLGLAASASAWKTPIIAQRGDGAVVRATAAAALVKAYTVWDGEVRDQVGDSLVAVADPSTADLVAALRATANPAVAASLDRLSDRIVRAARR